MELKKGYKQTEIGIIPQDWDIDCIENLASIKTGNRNTQDRIEDGLYPFFVRSQTVERINSYSFDGEAVLTAGDGVGVGKVVHYFKGKFDCHQRVYRITDFTPAINGYYFYLYFSNNFLNRIMQMTAKSSVDSIRMDMIAKMLIPIPPNKAEQNAIATALSDTDNYINHLEKLIAKKRLIKQGAMQKMLKPKDGWEVKKLGEIGEIITGSTPPTQIKKYWNGSIPWITPSDISNVDKNIYHSEREISDEGLQVIRKLPANTLLVTCIASIGKNAILRNKGACNQQINAIIPFIENDVDFLYYLMESNKQYLLSNAGITATLMISKKDFSEIEFFFPRRVEQTFIAKILSDMDSEIKALETKFEKYKFMKLGVMQKLLTGKIRLV